MRIGILTFHRAKNYGAVLQSYALVTYLKSLGHDACIIDYYPKYFKEQDCILPHTIMKESNVKGKLFILANILISLIPIIKRRNAFNDFIKSLPLNECIENSSDFSSDGYDLIFVGSDQVWNKHITRGEDKLFAGNFLHPNCILASYAASTIINNVDKEYYKNLINRFDFVSVREENINAYFNSLVPQKSICVCDPVLLLSKVQWKRFAKLPRDKNYVLIYTVPEDPRINDYADKVAKLFGCKVIKLVAKVSPFRKGDCRQSVSPSEFVGYFVNAKYIITTSFHGTAFSVKLEKPFSTLLLGTKLDDRAINFLNSVGMSNRLIDIETMSVPELEIDFALYKQKIDWYLKKSYNYIDKVVGSNEK